MLNQKDIIIHNNDQVSKNYVRLVLSKVFEMDKDTALEVTNQTHRLGSCLVFTGSEEEATKKIEAINIYNEASSSNLLFTQEDHGIYKQPILPSVVTEGNRLTLQLVNDTPIQEVFFYLGVFVKAANLPITNRDGRDLALNLVDGKEIVLKNFGSALEGSQKAAVLKNLIEALSIVGDEGDFKQEKMADYAFSVRPPGYTLNAAPQNKSKSKLL